MSILTIDPQSWSAHKIASEFGRSWRLAQKSKERRASEGILGNTTIKSGRELSEATVKKVIAFFVIDANSRIMPSKKDFVSVMSYEGCRLIKKILLLMDLRGIYVTYKDNHTDSLVRFSKFAQLRP